MLIHVFAQSQKKVSGYLSGQYNHTIYDRTRPNNPWGMGLGMQLFFNSSVHLKPTVDLTGDAYLENDKVLRLNPDGTPTSGIEGMVNLFAGLAFHPAGKFYVSVVAGPSIINGRALLGIKPSLGFYFSGNQNWMGKISFINVFNRDETTKEDFGSIGFSLGVRLF